MSAFSANGRDVSRGHNVIEQPVHLASGASVPARATVLVLGGTGFIGRALVGRLQSDGLAVRALVRDTAGRAESLARDGVELVHGDFTDTRCVEAALEGIRHVVHLVHLTRGAGSTWADCLRLDVEPTRRLAELCAARGIALYYSSSIAIYDGGRATDVITESTPPSSAAMRISLYARAKITCEQLLAQMHRERGLAVVVFRPGIVIGTGGNPLHPGVGAWPSASVCQLWGDGRHGLPFVLVDDCADAMARGLHTAGIAGQSFNLVGAPCLSGNAYLDALERIGGTRIGRVRLPTWWLFTRSAAKWGLQTLARNSARRLPSYGYIDGLSCRASYSADLAKNRLAWAPAADAATLIERGIVVPGSEPKVGHAAADR